MKATRLILLVLALLDTAFAAWTPVHSVAQHADCTSLKDSARDDSGNLHVLYTVPRPWTLWYLKLDTEDRVLLNASFPVAESETGSIAVSGSKIMVALEARHAIWFTESENSGKNWSAPTNFSLRYDAGEIERIRPQLIHIQGTGRLYLFYTKYNRTEKKGYIATTTRAPRSILFSAERHVIQGNEAVFYATSTYTEKQRMYLHIFASYSQGEGKTALHYLRSTSAGLIWSAAKQLAGLRVDGSMRVAVATSPEVRGHMYLSYGEFDEGANVARMRLRYSTDYGESWSAELNSSTVVSTSAPWLPLNNLALVKLGDSKHRLISFVRYKEDQYSYSHWELPEMRQNERTHPFSGSSSWGALASTFDREGELRVTLLVSNNSQYCQSGEVVVSTEAISDRE